MFQDISYSIKKNTLSKFKTSILNLCSLSIKKKVLCLILIKPEYYLINLHPFRHLNTFYKKKYIH